MTTTRDIRNRQLEQMGVIMQPLPEPKLLTAEDVLDWLKTQHRDHAKAKEYVREAEHQDGTTYWDHYFEGDRWEILEDFTLYVNNSV